MSEDVERENDGFEISHGFFQYIHTKHDEVDQFAFRKCFFGNATIHKNETQCMVMQRIAEIGLCEWCQRGPSSRVRVVTKQDATLFLLHHVAFFRLLVLLARDWRDDVDCRLFIFIKAQLTSSVFFDVRAIFNVVNPFIRDPCIEPDGWDAGIVAEIGNKINQFVPIGWNVVAQQLAVHRHGKRWKHFGKIRPLI